MEGPSQEEVDSLVWWHTLTFPNGVKARGFKGGGEESLRLEAEAAFKYSVRGKTVLDVGAWNGYFSVEAIRQGAKKVVALDKPAWEHPYFQGYKGFDLVRRYLAPEIEAVMLDIMDLPDNRVGKFDCVLFLGVLYHLKHPLYVLENLFDVTLEHLVVETHIDLVDHDRPVMIFYPGDELGGDPTNWWGPNTKCVIEMLKTVGFSRIECTIHPRDDSRAFFYAFK